MMLKADLFSRLSGINHGFFTRQGGVSEGLYASLNCGPGSQDASAHVSENRARAAQAMGASPDALCTLYQVHGADVITVHSPWQSDARPQADAMVTDQPNLMLGILTADCVPVLLADPKARIIGAAHAGWKGAIAGVTDQTVAAMEALGAHRDRLIAAIGPAIGWQSYEVDATFLQRFLDHQPTNEQFFRAHTHGKYHFNVKAYVAGRLAAAGVHHIQVLGNETYLEESSFFSFRRATHRSESDYGRQLSAIMLHAEA